MDFFIILDKEIFLFLNNLHADWLDPIMKFVTSSWFWCPIVILFIALSIKYYKKNFFIPVMFAIVCFCVTDVGSNIIKKNVKRYRPTHDIAISDKVHIVDNYIGGKYGFLSGHASNSFGLALISLLFIRKKYYAYIVISWAILVSYSRIYVGVHYPGDILAGILLGIIVALLTFRLFRSLPFFYNKLFPEHEPE